MRVNLFPNLYNTSFSSRQDVKLKTDTFSDDIINLARKNNLTDNEIRKVIHYYIPDVKIARQRCKMSRGAKQVGEYAANYTFSNASRSFDLGDKLLKLSRISGRTFTKSDCIENLVHEMTHAFQSEDKDCSIKNLFNKYLSGLSDSEIEKNVSHGFDFWFYFEDTIFNDYMNFYYKASSVNRNRFPFSVSIIPEEMKTCIAEKFKYAKKICPEFNEEFLKEFIKYQLHAEADAYEAGINALMKYKKSPMSKHDMALPELYRKVAACIE
ncbi:MAG: hypothetical protein K6A44_03730 [bacterium]|nr:hypothetical protein [bacterium]